MKPKYKFETFREVNIFSYTQKSKVVQAEITDLVCLMFLASYIEYIHTEYNSSGFEQ